jgi:hypothetical protein
VARARVLSVRMDDSAHCLADDSRRLGALVQVGQLGQNRMLFGNAFQSAQRVGRSGDEPPAEDFLDELPSPAWREDEASVECDAARVRFDRVI